MKCLRNHVLNPEQREAVNALLLAEVGTAASPQALQNLAMRLRKLLTFFGVCVEGLVLAFYPEQRLLDMRKAQPGHDYEVTEVIFDGERPKTVKYKLLPHRALVGTQVSHDRSHDAPV
jgi:hypothetical protein